MNSEQESAKPSLQPETCNLKPSFLIGVVGVCASGKSTLIKGLESRGYRARHIAQEHSYVKYMWKHITNPDVLIFLDVSHAMTIKRRQLSWVERDWEEQQRRLSHAREHADFYIHTDQRDEGEVLEEVLHFLQNFSAKGQFSTTAHP